MRTLAVLLLFALAVPALSAERQVVVSFDDLPDIEADDHTVEQMEQLTWRLVPAVRREAIPAIGFVNEDKLLGDGEIVDPRRVSLLRVWLDAGLELGNHTFSHPDLHEVPLEDYEKDILRGEEITRPLLAGRGMPLRWFRHPYLDTGKTLATRDAIVTFLSQHGYRVVPVTIDDSEWIFDAAYDKAISGRHFLTRHRLGRAYLRYMELRLAWAEYESELVFHRQIPQILLLHASQLNADYFAALARLIRRRGYRFVTVDQAMNDHAYETPDLWTGGGVGWIERWGVTMGIPQSKFDSDPKVPRWVQKYAGVKEE
jgi:peptidoglycan/xylan/chitin deacetylase (PgdA/CDA1 family)